MRNLFVLGREEVYTASSQVWAFHKNNDIIEGINVKLSNMFSGFPFTVNGLEWQDSEKLYLCGEYSNNTEEHNQIQQELMAYKSGYAAKRFGKNKHKKQVRADFAEFRIQWMLWVVWQKCKGNTDFRNLLLSLPDDVILVENTTTDNGGTAEIWGCKNKELVKVRKELEEKLTAENAGLTKKALEALLAVEINKVRNIGEWRGQNNIGKILMICRQAIKEGTEPTIDYALLRNKNIYICGKLMTFND